MNANVPSHYRSYTHWCFGAWHFWFYVSDFNHLCRFSVVQGLSGSSLLNQWWFVTYKQHNSRKDTCHFYTCCRAQHFYTAHKMEYLWETRIVNFMGVRFAVLYFIKTNPLPPSLSLSVYADIMCCWKTCICVLFHFGCGVHIFDFGIFQMNCICVWCVCY